MLQHTGQRCQQHLATGAHGTRLQRNSSAVTAKHQSAAHTAAPLAGRQQAARQAPVQGRRSLRARANKAGEIAYEELMKVAEEACRRGEQVRFGT